MTTAASFDSLAGRVRLRPGQPLPRSIESTRPELAPRLARGRLASELPGLLATVFTLCGHAHRVTAERAVGAAQGLALGDGAHADNGRALQLSTAREQVLRLVNDWPRDGSANSQGAVDDAIHPLLRSCPLWRPDLSPADQLAELPGWLQHRWLGMAPADWLRRHDADPLAWPAQWALRHSATHGNPIARWLHQVRRRALALHTPSRPLALLADTAAAMPALARRLQDEDRAAAWADTAGMPDTGPWSRHHAPCALPADNAWMRLTSRLTDLLRLAAPGGGQWLAHGGLAIGTSHGTSQGMAWSETARGLLVHWVRLQDSADGPRVAGFQMLAPTDWNFHPRGVLAEALSALPPDGDEGSQRADTRLLALAFDPCVAFDIEAHAPKREAEHA